MSLLKVCYLSEFLGARNCRNAFVLFCVASFAASALGKTKLNHLKYEMNARFDKLPFFISL
jgi:hypothetical protein